MHEPTQVEAQFNSDGTITLFSFSWQGSQLPVLSMGREWPAAAGRHFLVTTTEKRVFELVFEPTNLAWHVVSAPKPKLVA
jgi:hypothetical protein